MPRIMEAFFTTKPEGEGTGLGLAICRRVMKETCGNIDIESTLGEGTVIRLIFPSKSDGNSKHLKSD
jgi:signal transduction histidine kinase